MVGPTGQQPSAPFCRRACVREPVWTQHCYIKLKLKLKLKLIYDRRSVGQSVLLSDSNLEPMTRFCFLSDDCGFLDVWHPLWREDGSVIYLYNCFWALPEHSLLGRSPAELLSHLRPPTWRARSMYLYPPGTGWPSYTPGNCLPFLSPLTTRRDYGGGILTRLHTGL
jgi:hypothetical protein